MPAEVTSLALGQLDESYEMDLAIAAGRELVVVHGRDRKLSLDAVRQAEVKPATISKREFPYKFRSIALGDFSGNHTTDIAMLGDDGVVHLLSKGSASSNYSAADLEVRQWGSKSLTQGSWSEAANLVRVRASSVPIDNLVVVDSKSRELRLIAGDAEWLQSIETRVAISSEYKGASVPLDMESGVAAVLPMRLNSDALSDLVILRDHESKPSVVTTAAGMTFTVTNTNDSGPSSLRQAIIDANSNPGADTINFNISGTGVPTIKPLSALPTVFESVVIDGSTQSAGRVEINGTNAGTGVNGLTSSAENTTVRGLVINSFLGFHSDSGQVFFGAGVYLLSNANCLIEGNYIGTDVQGKGRLGNDFGVFVEQSNNNTIGGTTPPARNIISGNNGTGIDISGESAIGNKILGNFVGVDVTGTAKLGNGSNISIFNASANSIGYTIPGARNIISGSRVESDGVAFLGININGRNVDGANSIQGNFIGTDVSGRFSLGNGATAIIISDSFSNTIGGTSPIARNVISGNEQDGVVLFGSKSAANLIQGNLIGTDVNGTSPLGNKGTGVQIFAPDSTVGGIVVSARNTISSNRFRGVSIDSNSAENNQVQGNFIGTDITGTIAFGNGGGIGISSASNNTIGGTIPTARNIIASSGGNGITIIGNGDPESLAGSIGNLIQGNFIGTDVTGSRPLGNLNGIAITLAANNMIGGLSSEERNIISGNTSNGVVVGYRAGALSGGATGNLVEGNYIGTDVTGASALSNGEDGIFVDSDSFSNTIHLNRIAFNKGNGVNLPTPTLGKNPVQIAIRNNSIYSNTALGINLGPAGPTPNPHNLLTGPNLLQNFPELTSVTTASDKRTITEVKGAAITLIVTGKLSASPNTDYTIEFFFGSNCEGQGHEHTGAIPVSVGTEGVRTNGSGDVTFTHKFDLPSGNTNPTGFVNCTATDPVGNTSEFCQCVSVTVTPTIVNVSRSGKNLIVAGQNFSSGAVVMINDQSQKTLYDDQNPTTTLIAKKAGKSTHSGDRVQVRNSDGTVSASYVMP
jgi:hypothetical protein